MTQLTSQGRKVKRIVTAFFTEMQSSRLKVTCEDTSDDTLFALEHDINAECTKGRKLDIAEANDICNKIAENPIFKTPAEQTDAQTMAGALREIANMLENNDVKSLAVTLLSESATAHPYFYCDPSAALELIGALHNTQSRVERLLDQREISDDKTH